MRNRSHKMNPHSWKQGQRCGEGPTITANSAGVGLEGSSNPLVGRVVRLKGSRIPGAPQTTGKQKELQERAYRVF